MIFPAATPYIEPIAFFGPRIPFGYTDGIRIKDTTDTHFESLPKDITGMIGAYANYGRERLELFKVEKFPFTEDESRSKPRSYDARYRLGCLSTMAAIVCPIIGAPWVVTAACISFAVALLLNYVILKTKESNEFVKNFEVKTVTNPLFKQVFADLDELGNRILKLRVPFLENMTVGDFEDYCKDKDESELIRAVYTDENYAAFKEQFDEIYALTRSLAARYRDYPSLQRFFGPDKEAFVDCNDMDAMLDKFDEVGEPYDFFTVYYEILRKDMYNAEKVACSLQRLRSFAEDCKSDVMKYQLVARMIWP